MKRHSIIMSILAFFFLAAMPTSGQDRLPQGAPLDESRLTRIEDIVEKAVRDGKTPGAVVLIGNGEGIVYRRAFGYRSLEPERALMAEDVIFDVASLTKVVGTGTAVMQLVEAGRLKLDAPAAKYWPAFGKNDKSGITIRHLLTHRSGLKSGLTAKPVWLGYPGAMGRIVAERPVKPPGGQFLYSDINFAALGEIVRRVSGEELDVYCAGRIFRPLGMKDTTFRLPDSARVRTAPTVYRDGRMLCGEVHDPSCEKMGGVAGHAGLFSTADDVSRFARMMLGGGSLGGVRILRPGTIAEMTSPQPPWNDKSRHGLAWALDAPLSDRRETVHRGPYGHLGYTGTALWIDPVTKIYCILLTNRVHPKGLGDVAALRAEIKAAVFWSRETTANDQVHGRTPGGANDWSRQIPQLENGGRGTMQTGIDVLRDENYASLSGLRIGLITNHTGRDGAGRRTIGLLHQAPGVRLKAIFSPEHGLSGTADKLIRSTTDSSTGLPVYSLYGQLRRPSDAMLEGIDALVFDIQDAGVRFYTYISTMGYTMEAAAKKKIAFYVLDRPNPLNASAVQGPVADEDRKSFTSYFPLPVRHGMTVGELAEMFNAETGMGAKLTVVRMHGYRRTAWYDETGLAWINPSPNLRSLTGATLYPGVAMAEGANISVGRGTDTPFECFGAPWVDGRELSAYLNGRGIPGVRFLPVAFTPASSSFRAKRCQGVRIILTDRLALDSPALGLEIIAALHRFYPGNFALDDTLGLVGSRAVLDAVRRGEDPRAISLHWQEPLAAFIRLRSRYLLY